MSYTFRELRIDDLQQIIELYRNIYVDNEEKAKDYEELRWLFSDPENPDKLNGFIAIDDKENVAGVIGYVINTYKYKEKEFTGVIPMSWMISPESRGIMGIQEKKNKIRKGRIVHISYIENDIEVYRETIARLEKFLTEKKCCSISVLALNPNFRKVLRLCGYKTISKADRAIYVRDQNISTHSIPYENWHITYYESDKDYRSM